MTIPRQGPLQDRAKADIAQSGHAAARPSDRRAAELAAGLRRSRAMIDPKFLYDTQGCVLFNAICELDEYYPTRTERAIFETHRDAIVGALPAGAQWVDLGCGDCAKSRGFLAHADVRRYLGVDIAVDWIRAEVDRLGRQFPGIDCVAVAADFAQGLDLSDELGDVARMPPVFFYPGSSIGNFPPERAVGLLGAIRGQTGPAGCLLISADLRKDPGVLEHAYADDLGVTAAFNRNVLRVCNQVLGSDFHPECFDHEACFDAAHGRIEMHLVARAPQRVRWPGGERAFQAGEAIVTEYSYKYTPAQFEGLLAEAGFSRCRMWTDARGWFGVFLAQP
ncbi:Histidine-specific methyltransferase EgtD [Pigmentiphaga humi]|uniref:Histidine-specific methyltransferase EgtD n=1 Tax=Pigmentiphaga humi TaxID=2478468 RepID=A0A3P4B0P1_9BURK|nr:L-histidine N(alpha)-methyltransferase [Pigmentiphaga humi]VCU69854.1 Histidine-specific methyltransferase EgtD [Pigmentiphaga humi]